MTAELLKSILGCAIADGARGKSGSGLKLKGGRAPLRFGGENVRIIG